MAVTIDLTGKAALVTGGSRGIGRALSLLLARTGADVAVGYRRGGAEARSVVKEIMAAGASGVALRADVSRPAQAARLVGRAIEKLGRVDILVNNAGIWEESSIAGMEERELERTLATNLKGAIHCTRAAVPGMIERKWGRIISISSTAALLGEPMHAHYAASKGGLEAFSRSAAVEFGPYGITVNCVAPGWTATELAEEALRTPLGRKLRREIPLRKVASPEEVAWAVLHLASEEAGHTTGISLLIDGGYSLRR